MATTTLYFTSPAKEKPYRLREKPPLHTQLATKTLLLRTLLLHAAFLYHAHALRCLRACYFLLLHAAHIYHHHTAVTGDGRKAEGMGRIFFLKAHARQQNGRKRQRACAAAFTTKTRALPSAFRRCALAARLAAARYLRRRK